MVPGSLEQTVCANTHWYADQILPIATDRRWRFGCFQFGVGAGSWLGMLYLFSCGTLALYSCSMFNWA